MSTSCFVINSFQFQIIDSLIKNVAYYIKTRNLENMQRNYQQMRGNLYKAWNDL
jgi:hypothetical protein